MMTLPRRPSTGSDGFTLVELMIAIMMTSLAFTAIFATIHAGISMQLYVREMGDAEQLGPAILQQMAEDLHNAYFYNVADNDYFEGRAVDAGGDVRTDQIHFVTTRGSLLDDPWISNDDWRSPSPLTEISYVCKEGPDGYFELHRREQNFLDDDPFQGGYYRLITDRVLSFRVQYTGWDFGSEFGEGGGLEGIVEGARNDAAANEESNSEGDEENPEEGTLVWEDEWSAKEKGALPVAIKIELVVEPAVDPDVRNRLQLAGRLDELEKSYIHIVLLPQFREDPAMVEATSNWDGTVAEPAVTGGPAGGVGAVANRTSAARGVDGAAGGRGRGARGGDRAGAAANNPQNPFLNLPRGNAGGQQGGSNPFLNLLRQQAGNR